MKFTLTIDLGNEAMRYSPDLAEAIIQVAETIQRDGWNGAESTVIRDTNGNTVGKWEVTELDLKAECREMLKNATFQDGYGTILTHDAEAIEKCLE